MYLVTKRFTDGTLKGLAIQERTTVPFEVGEKIPAGTWTGPGYVVEAVEEAER